MFHGLNHLSDQIKFLASFWTLTSKEFKSFYPFFMINLCWNNISSKNNNNNNLRWNNNFYNELFVLCMIYEDLSSTTYGVHWFL